MSKTSKRGKAATASNGHHALNGKAAKHCGLVVTISGIAEKLARLDWHQSERLKADISDGKSDGRSITPFEILRDRANAEAEVLEALLLQQDPSTPDETLALVCLVDTHFQAWAAKAYSDQELSKEEEERWDQLTRALAAMARWLHRTGATSPVRCSHFGDRTMLPVEEQIADAQRRASELAVWHSAAEQEGRR